MLKIIKKRDLLNEALGVPDGLPETAKKIYFGILNSIPHSANFNRLNGLKLLISGNYIVGDYSFNKVNFDIRIVEDNDFKLLGMSTGTDMVLDKEVKNNIGSVGSVKNRYIHVSRDLRQRPQTPYGFDLSVDFSGPKSGPKMVRGEDILKYFIQNKNKMITIIGHELMHLYDFYKNKKRNLNTQVKNILSQLDLSIDIPSLTTFKQMLYFVNSNENIVRMSEIGSAIVAGDVTKKDFTKLLEKDDTFNILQMIKKYSFSNFKSDILKDKEKIVNVLIYNNVIPPFFKNYLMIDNNKFLETAMDFFREIIKQSETNLLNDFLTTGKYNNGNKYSDDEKKEVLRKQNLGKGENGEQYFEKMIKSFNFEAEKVLRKIFKLYAMAKDVPNPKLPKAMKRMKTESKWINMDHWDTFMKSQKNKDNMQSKDGITKGYIY
jgi:hypothetical protein